MSGPCWLCRGTGKTTKGPCADCGGSGSDRTPTRAERSRVTKGAIEAAEWGSTPWNIVARACLEWLACTRERFTSDAFWAAMDRAGIPRPREPRANGGPFLYAAAKGQRWIRQEGTSVPSTRTTTAHGTTHHGTKVPVYVSLIYGRKPTLGWPR